MNVLFLNVLHKSLIFALWFLKSKDCRKPSVTLFVPINGIGRHMFSIIVGAVSVAKNQGKHILSDVIVDVS